MATPTVAQAAKSEEMLAFVLDAARKDGDAIPEPETLRFPETETARAM